MASVRRFGPAGGVRQCSLAGGVRRFGLVGGVVLALVSGCSSDSGGTTSPGIGTDAGTRNVDIVVTPEGCPPSPARVDAGLIRFHVRNQNASDVTEAELLAGSTILGEKENLVPGLDGTFTLRLQPGRYTVYCPNAKQPRSDFVVTGENASPTAAAATEAASRYHQFVVAQVQALVTETATFCAAVKAGDLAAARRAYPAARWHYEAIEPVAESFGDLDPAIDARLDDVADPAEWTGFHRLEKALWQDNSLAGMTAVADRLQSDVRTLADLVATQTYQPAQIANGAVELLDEIARSKVTGEEERYSHTDLYDIDANLAGSKAAFQAVEPILRERDPALATTIDARFADVEAALRPLARGTGWVSYETVDAATRRNLAQRIDALAEPLSRVAAVVG
jgi:iron uptake system component EfeO